MTNIPVSTQLDLAADAIQMAGWTQGPDGWPGYGPEGSGLCLEGGIMAAVGIEDYDRGMVYARCDAYRAVADYLALPEGEYAFEWNDATGRTEQDVIETLRAAAAVERVKEAVAGGQYDTEDQPLPLDEKAVA